MSSLRVPIAFALAMCAAAAAPAHSARSALKLPMQTHAAFFSKETRQARALDPQVFVRDRHAPAGAGPQNIAHAAGLRPAFLSDPPRAALFNAEGKPLGFTLAQWLGAKGTVDVAADSRTVSVHLRGLRPGGIYSLFENHFDRQPIGFTPLDGTGAGNSFVASPRGTAAISIRAPEPLNHDNAVLLVFHSDGAAHGASRGEIGVSAQHQLIARLP